MGGLCSKTSNVDTAPSTYNFNGHEQHINFYNWDKAGGSGGDSVIYQSEAESNLSSTGSQHKQKQLQLDEQEKEKEVKQSQEPFPYSNNADDDFYDGIPRYPSLKSRSIGSKQAAVAKVSQVSSRLGRAGTLGLGKAVEVLDTLGSSMTNLNPTSGFASGPATKGNELAILAFEVANTIVKGCNLMQSLSKRSIRHLKEVVLPSEGVQNLISEDVAELLKIVAADKREEFKIFLGEVVRFGNRSKDPQWHNLDRYFEKISRGLAPQTQLREEAESVIVLLMTSVHYTSELYHELQVLNKIEQDYQRKCQENDNAVANQKGGSLAILKTQLKSRRKKVQNLKKKSLWSRSLEEVMEKLVEIVRFLLLEIRHTFGSDDSHVPTKGSVSDHQRLGPAGLSLHYANIVMQIDTLVAQSSSMPSNTRDTLYQSLLPTMKSALRSKLQSFLVKEELTVTDIKDEMEKTLQWLVPMSTNTAKAHHGFGWVGEWANTRSEVNRRPAAGPADIIQIETLHHASKEKTEAYILELVLWLHHMFSKSKTCANGWGMKLPIKSAICTPLQKSNQKPTLESPNAPSLTIEDQKMLQDASKKKWMPGISKSLDFDLENSRLKKHERLSKSTSHLSTRQSKGSVPVTVKRLPSGVPIIGFGIDKEKLLDVIDGVDVLL